MAEDMSNNPALAFAIYASTAATAAVAALREAGLIEEADVQRLVANLTLCRQISGDVPALIEHAELLTDILLDPAARKTK